LFNFFLMSSMKYLNHMLMAFKFKIHENETPAIINNFTVHAIK
jgi:hypothetical protein